MTFKDIMMNRSVIKNKALFREFVSEFMGTFTLLTIGNSVIAAYLLKGKDPEPFAVCFAFGIGAMIATLGCGHISGAHINPAGTVSLAILGKFPLKKVWYYLIAQYLAGFVSSVVIYLVYFDAINIFDRESNPKLDPASIFATFPFKHTTLRGVLIDQIVGTGMLFFSLNCIGNTKGFSLPKGVQAPVICLLITGCCLAFGLNAGAIFNPARDFPTRLFALAVYGTRVFEPLNWHYWWAAGIIGPHIGALLGTYLFSVTCDHYSEEDEKNRSQNSTFEINDTTKRAAESTMSIC